MKKDGLKPKMDEHEKIRDDFVHLARIALSDRQQDVQAFIHRIAKRTGDPSLSAALVEILRKRPTRSSPLRRATEVPLPVDTDSRFQLLRVEERPELPHDPIYTDKVRDTLKRIVDERDN